MSKGLLKILFSVLLLQYAIWITTYSQNRILDSLRMLLQQSTSPAEKIPLLQEMSVNHIYIKPRRTTELAWEAFNLAKSINDQKNMCLSLNLVGYGHWGRGESARAFDYYKLSLEMARELKDEVLVARNYQSLGLLYNQSGYYAKNISTLRDYALPIFKRYNVNERLPSLYNSTAVAYTNLKQYDSALHYLATALPLAKQYRPSLYPTVMFNHADLYFKTKKYDSSKWHVLEAGKLAASISDKRMLSRTHQLMADLNLLDGDADAAVANATKAVQLAEEAEIKESAFPSYLSLSKAYKAKGNFEVAFQYLQTHLALKDSVRNRETATNINLYEFEDQQSQIEFLKIEEKQNRYLLYSALATAIVLASFLFYVLWMRRKTEQSNRLLEQKNKEIEAQAEQLRDTNEVKLKLFSIVAHDLRSPLASIIGILSLLENDTVKPEEIVPHLPALSQNVGETITMLDNLLQWSLSQLEGVAANPELFNVNEVIHSKIKLYEQEAKRKGIRFDALTRENETVMADKNMVGIVLQNLINNAVKFTEAGGIVKINAEKNNTSGVTISVADTGRGMGRDKIARLINGNGFTTEGTGQEKGVGLGFQICKEFIHLNNGKLDIQSEENEGTVVMITLPRQ